MATANGVLDSGAIKLHRKGKGPALVLVHCLGVDRRLWDIAAGLQSDFTLVSYDLPGHGETPVPDSSYGVEDLSEQLAGALDRAGLDRIHLAGISLGGCVAQHLAATRPERVDRLMLIDTTPRYPDEQRKGWGERAAIARTKGVPAMIDMLLNIWFTPAFAASGAPAVAYVRECFARIPGEGYAKACEALAEVDLLALAPRIKAPTLIVIGEDDLPAFHESAKWLEQNIAGARKVVLAPARHASILERPAEFSKAAREFLRG
jgi:3-oxoadipate enol-lactonase